MSKGKRIRNWAGGAFIKPGGIYVGIIFSHKKEGNLAFVTTWMNLEDIMLSEIRESQKDKYCMIPLR